MAKTWTHRAARVLVRPLVGTRVTPNHLTTLRLASGLAAGAALALGTRGGNLWAGVLWLVSAFLDRADGEFARMSGLSSPAGHTYDFIVDVGVNASFFLAMGIGQRHSTLGGWSVVLGAMSCGAMLALSCIAEAFEKRLPTGVKTLGGRWGFDPDDALYVLGPLCWLGPMALAPSVVLAAFGTTGFMLAFLSRYLAALRRAPVA